MPLNIHDLGADLLTLSAHKLGGAKGAGALIKRDEALHIADPLIRGGGQERGAAGRHGECRRHRGIWCRCCRMQGIAGR